MPALWDPLSACRIVLICRAQIVYSSSERPSIDAGKRILKSNDGFLVSGLPRGLAGMPALSACQIVLIYRLQIVYYWSIQRPSVRTSITVTVIDAGRRILKSNDRFLVPGLPRGLAGMPALWDPLSACRIVLICRAQIVYSSSERPSGSYPTLR
jgi:hypothetical protein